MENWDVVNSVQEIPSSSADSDVRNTPSSVCNSNCNRSPSSNPNGVSGYSGNSRPSLKPGSVELFASFMQDIQDIGNADTEIVKTCETRWLQLLRLVEKQCQQQIVAQQEQFHHQIQVSDDFSHDLATQVDEAKMFLSSLQNSAERQVMEVDDWNAVYWMHF
ncbi:hypothetical protein BTVI_65459 [Pitangus sulphuratus]|nr:hypothetical protein BTVI_65459 [Pitangus sulphuratus]